MNNSLPAVHLALVGVPNSGKTALFNALTGGRQHVANRAGVTVEGIEGSFYTPQGQRVDLLDLPGLMGLRDSSPDAMITRDTILNHTANMTPLDGLICVGDAVQLLPTIRLCLELKQIGLPVLLVVNMMDIARARGREINLAALSARLGIPVESCVSVRKHGTTGLLQALDRILPQWPRRPTAEITEIERAQAGQIRAWHTEAVAILRDVLITTGRQSRFTDAVDRFVLNPILGLPILIAVMFLLFQAVFAWANPAIAVLDSVFIYFSGWLTEVLPQSWWRDLLTDGIIAGVGGVLKFVPQIVILFVLMLLLEDFGYMSRAVFMTDRLMTKIGLSGYSFIPLLSSMACAVPGIMATRVIANRRDRLMTIMVAPLMTCSARLSVYTLIIGAMIPDTRVFGIFGLQGLVLFILYAVGIIAALAIAISFKLTQRKRQNVGKRYALEPLLLHLPDYKMPSWKNVLDGTGLRAWEFIRRAGTVILALSVLLWILSVFPAAPPNATGPAIEYSFAGMLGHALAPIMEPIGFNWQMSLSLIPAMAAREMALAALATVYAVSGDLAEGISRNGSLGSTLSTAWSLPSALAFLAWFVFAPQCLATLAVVHRETRQKRFVLIMFVYMTVLAYAASFVTYRVAGWVLG